MEMGRVRGRHSTNVCVFAGGCGVRCQLDRFPVSFKSNVNGHTYRHIVLVIKCKVRDVTAPVVAPHAGELLATHTTDLTWASVCVGVGVGTGQMGRAGSLPQVHADGQGIYLRCTSVGE